MERLVSIEGFATFVGECVYLYVYDKKLAWFTWFEWTKVIFLFEWFIVLDDLKFDRFADEMKVFNIMFNFEFECYI